jgi:hypothetical protein
MAPTRSNGSLMEGPLRAGSVGTARAGAISPPPPSILHPLAESEYEHVNGHVARFSESLVGQAPLSPSTVRSPTGLHNGYGRSQGPPSVVVPAPPSLTRSRSEKAADRLSILGARFGSLRRKKTAPS